ncbi:MAG: serine/threonine-protein phosphatase [Pirellulaceae bacterium]|nr:serine/threonine-protein phosphatase [Pirellulaceae bacterium]
MTTLNSLHSDRMQCMEVWGGNAQVSRNFQVPGLDVWVNSRPYADAVSGGDVYYVSSCASGRITRLLLADVSGHGQAVADAARCLRDLMRKNINLVNQTRFVQAMNRQFTEQPDPTLFATALVCTFFAPTGSLQFCNAGHPPAMLYRARERRWVSASDVAHIQNKSAASDVPLGVLRETEYSKFKTKLAPGDMMMCVSDAFIEACDSTGKLLGVRGLLDLVQNLSASNPAEIIPQIQEHITRQHQENLQQDDASILLFRADGTHSTLASDLLAPMRLFTGVRDSTDIG